MVNVARTPSWKLNEPQVAAGPDAPTPRRASGGPIRPGGNSPVVPLPNLFAPASPLAAAVALAGMPTPAHLDHAQNFLAGLPPRLRDAARNPAVAPVLVYGLLLDQENAAVRAAQRAGLAAASPAGTLPALDELAPALAPLPASARLPLLNLALPALRQLDDATVATFEKNCGALVAADGFVSTFEFALQKALFRHLDAARHPRSAAIINYYSFNAVVDEISLALSALAHAGADDPAAAQAAFADALECPIPPLLASA